MCSYDLGMQSKNLHVSIGLAAELAQPTNIARREQIVDTIDGLVGTWEWRSGKQVLVWPAEVCDRAGQSCPSARRARQS